MGLTALDIIVLIGVAITAGLGAMRGFVTEVLSLLTWVLVVFALKLAHLPVTHALTGVVGTTSGAAVLAFVLVGGVAWLVGRMIAKNIGGRTRQSILGPLDRAMGLGFGALKGLVLASLAFLLFVLVIDTAWGGASRRPTWLTKSRTYPLLNATSKFIGDIIARRQRGEAMFGPDNSSDAGFTLGNSAARHQR
jgi:membrane protein required for colicin V production